MQRKHQEQTAEKECARTSGAISLQGRDICWFNVFRRQMQSNRNGGSCLSWQKYCIW